MEASSCSFFFCVLIICPTLRLEKDGATHHGSFDLAYLKYIPNLTIMAPANETELQDMFNTALTLKWPSVIRYPRGSGTRIASFHRDFEVLEVGKSKLEKGCRRCERRKNWI